MNEAVISVRRGEPFKVLLIVLIIWITGRVLWNEVYSAKKSPAAFDFHYSETVFTNDLLTRHAANPSPARREPLSRFSGSERFRVENRKQEINGVGAEARAQQSLQRSTVRWNRLEDALLPVEDIRREPSTVEPISSDSLRADLPSPSNSLSGYFWVYARQGSNLGQLRSGSPTIQFPVAQYGASQAGAILTHRMFGNNNRNVSVFGRASTALSSSGEEELAVGIKAKALAHIPVSFYVEQRFGAGDGYNRGTAFYLAGGSGPDTVLPDIGLETYGQMGYVFGQDDSYFFDVSATLQKQIIERDRKKITAGAAIWSSGQEGATRIDIGPRLRFHIPVDQVDMQISVDWRERIGGNANPGSGAAVTLSTGF